MGDNTHHQDQLITLHNLRPINRIVRAPVKLMPEEDDELEVMRFGCRVSFFKSHVNANSKMSDTITKCKCCHSCSNHNSITKTFCP